MAAKPIKLIRKRLDDTGLAEHFASLAAEAKVVEIRIKGAAAGYSEAATGSLQEAARRLAAGEISAVQIQFLSGEQWWTDTVMRAADGFRLVRMRQESPPP
jgi:hypothetical protein